MSKKWLLSITVENEKAFEIGSDEKVLFSDTEEHRRISRMAIKTAQHFFKDIPDEPEPMNPDPRFRFAISRNENDENGPIEIISCITQTTLVLPAEDIPLLINSLMSLGQKSSSPEIIDLDPSS